MSETRIVSGTAEEEDRQFDLSLRPQGLAEFVGQPKLKEVLGIAIEAAKARGEAMDHVLLYGPPGLGKTTLAGIIANELDVKIDLTSGPVLQRKLDLTGALTSLETRQVFFIDEVHRLFADVEEMLYSALEDYRVDLMVGAGPGARRTGELPPRGGPPARARGGGVHGGRAEEADHFAPRGDDVGRPSSPVFTAGLVMGIAPYRGGFTETT